MRRPRTQGDAEGPPAAGRRWPRPSRPLSGPGEGMRRGPGGSGTEPRCPPGSPRRPSTASRPGEGERGGGERGGGCPLTGRGRGRACSYGVSEGSPPWLQGGGISWVNPNFLGNLGIWGGIQCLCPRSAAGPAERFPVGAVEAILRDVLRGYLQEQPYEPGTCREMAKTIAEVIKARVKALLVPRYKIVVVTHIGQLNEQSMQIGSRCLWDPVTDTFSSYVFKNTSLFALANVYAIYFE
uniref:Tctex1 domain containing 1 n=1 Tax=Cairina moschata TaxID=8855 RepID=A0A8C3B394_CAIMO